LIKPDVSTFLQLAKKDVHLLHVTTFDNNNKSFNYNVSRTTNMVCPDTAVCVCYLTGQQHELPLYHVVEHSYIHC